MDNLLEVTGLNKSYENIKLKNIDFSLKKGNVTILAGTSGAGKTALLHLLLGLSKKDSGDIKIFGMELEKDEFVIKNRIGVVFDKGSFYDDLTTFEMKSIIAPAYENWNEADYVTYMESFSIGLRQPIAPLDVDKRICFALALALSHKPELLIIDEPSDGFEPEVRTRLLIAASDFIKRGGKGVLYSTHNISGLDKYGDDLIIIDGGQIVLKDKLSELIDAYSVKKNQKTEKVMALLEELMSGGEEA